MLSKDFLANTWQRLPPDALETVTYFSKATEQIPGAGQSVPNVRRLPVQLDVVTDEDAELSKDGVMFDFWAGQMSGVTWANPDRPEPKRNDVFDDARGVRYVVKRAKFLDMNQRFRLLCLEG